MSSESQILQQIYESTASAGKKIKVNLLDAFLDHFANDSVNKYDRGFSLPSKRLKDVLKKNQFQTKLRRLGYKLSLEGSGYGLAIFRYKNESYIDIVKITNIIKRFGRVVELYFNTDEYITIKDSQKDQEITLQGRFYYDDKGKVQKEVGYFAKSQWKVKEDAITYDTEEIPVMPFDNNSLKTPDIRRESKNLIKQAGEFINRIPREYEKGKTIFAFNNMINSINNGKDFNKKVIDNGDDTFDLQDPDGVVANSIAPISNGLNTVEMIERLFGFYDARARELSFQFRDHGSDSRKNELDLLILNQKPFEYMMSKMSHREEQLQEFIDLLAKIEKTKTAKIKIVISDFEQNRIDNIQAITDLKVAQAKQNMGIAKKNEAEAELLIQKVNQGNIEGYNPDVDPTSIVKSEALAPGDK